MVDEHVQVPAISFLRLQGTEYLLCGMFIIDNALHTSCFIDVTIEQQVIYQVVSPWYLEHER